MESKVQLRKQIKRIRDEIPVEERTAYSRRIADIIAKQPWYETNTLLMYSAIQSEVDLSWLSKSAWRDGKQLYFPKVHGEDMEFYRISGTHQLKSGAFQVMEPDIEHNELEIFRSKEARFPILVPGVAFSAEGQRIGYGKGYYDRYLLNFPNLIPIGICFEQQLAERIETEPQDKNMQYVVTQLGIYEGGCL